MNKIMVYMLSALFLLPAVSCRDDKPWSPPQPEGEVSVLFTYKTPYDARNGERTRSITELEEEQVVNIDVLAFVEDNSGNYLYEYTASGTQYYTDSQTSSFYSKVKLFQKEQIFIILVNASSELAASGILMGEEIESATAKLICVSDDEWSARINGAGSFRPIPMFARTFSLVLSDNMGSISGFPLLRMLSRIDVSVNSEVTNFVLAEAMIYNRMTCGNIAFDQDVWDYTEKHVTAPGTPLVHPLGTPLKVKQPAVVYTADQITHDILRSIYTFESEASTVESDATSIVVGGYFGVGNTDTQTYYRIDIPPDDQSYYSGPILRNHIYEVVVKSVSGPGASSPDGAFKRESSIIADISKWNLANNSVIFDDHYRLTLSSSEAVFTYAASNLMLNVKTDYPGNGAILAGIYIGDIQYEGADTGWLSVTGGNNGEMERDLTLLATENQAAARTARFIISAGNMKYTFKVTQQTRVIL